MSKKSVHRLFVHVLPVCGLCLLMVAALAAQTNRTRGKSLEVLFEEFKAAKNLPCGQRSEAVIAGREIVERFAKDEPNSEVVEDVKKQLDIIIPEEIKCNAELSLKTLYDKFRAADKLPCGQRFKALGFSKLILALYADDAINREVVDFVKKRTTVIEKEDPVCVRENVYNESFKAKNWAGVFAMGKIIIGAESDKPKALDIMLDLAQVGYDRMAYEESDAYNVETVNYAVRALELMNKGVKTNGCWGAFMCFRDREKALGWLNYIVGYVSYFGLKGGKKAMPYFYGSTKYKMEFKYDAFVYQAVAKYYFDQQASMASGLTIGAFINRAQNIAARSSEPGNNFAPETDEEIEIAALHRQLVNLYNLRYNLEENEKVTDLSAYIQILLDRPLLEPSKNKAKSNKE